VQKDVDGCRLCNVGGLITGNIPFMIERAAPHP